MQYSTAVIGLGNIGMRYALDERMTQQYPHPSHVSALRAHRQSAFMAGCDRQTERLQEFRRHYPDAGAYAEVRHMLDDEKLDCVAVCVPPNQQARVSRLLIDAGVPMILCEKPFCETAEQAREVLHYAREKGASLAVNYWRTFDESHRKVVQIVKSGELGEIQSVRGVYGNGLFNNASHVLRFWLSLFGPVEWVEGHALNVDRREDENVRATLRFRSGLMAALDTVRFDAFRMIEMDIIGTKGRLVIADEGLAISRQTVAESRYVSGAHELNPSAQIFPVTAGAGLDQVYDRLFESLEKEEPLLDLESVETLHLLEALRVSANREGKRVFPAMELAEDKLAGVSP